jgi:hypothetical protein
MGKTRFSETEIVYAVKRLKTKISGKEWSANM